LVDFSPFWSISRIFGHHFSSFCLFSIFSDGILANEIAR
jgi:hypothetical protein